jgi:hypothetical protein
LPESPPAARRDGDGNARRKRINQRKCVMKPETTNLKAGDWVEVRSKQEILRTLDGQGELDGMPFMPEMFAFCGKRFQVYKRAHKTCDTVFPVRGRWVAQAVHLNTRCDGGAHDGCQAGCLLFWKTAWLKPVDGAVGEKLVQLASPRQGSLTGAGRGETPGAGCSEVAVWARTRRDDSNSGTPTYVCQSTQLPYATHDLEWWDIRQYIEDYRSGNVTLWQMCCGAVYVLYYTLCEAGLKLGRPMRWFYDAFHRLWRGTPFPQKRGSIPEGKPTPCQTLNLRPGETVRVKSYDAILKTLNTQNRNRGLYWDAEEVPYCGGSYQVLRRVRKIINEKTGKMLEMKTPCVVLDSVVCKSRYSACRMFCPRSIYSYWREIWLERVTPAEAEARAPESRPLALAESSKR